MPRVETAFKSSLMVYSRYIYLLQLLMLPKAIKISQPSAASRSGNLSKMSRGCQSSRLEISKTYFRSINHNMSISELPCFNGFSVCYSRFRWTARTHNNTIVIDLLFELATWFLPNFIFTLNPPSALLKHQSLDWVRPFDDSSQRPAKNS